MSALAELARRFAELESRVEQLDRQRNNLVREARVTEIDAANGVAKVEAHGLPSAWSPWLERAGTIRTWTPPSVGERVLLVSPSGEPGRGLILAGGYSDQYPAPHDQAGEHRIAIGSAALTIKDGMMTLKVGGSEIEIKQNAVNVVAQKVHTVAEETHLSVASKDQDGDKQMVLEDGLPQRPVKSLTDGSGGLAAAMAAASDGDGGGGE